MRRSVWQAAYTAAAAFVLCTGCALLAGCGSTANDATGRAPRTTSTSTTTTTLDATARLEDAVRSAIQMNAKLSSYTLWHNSVPSWAARSTGGPALQALRSSAVERRGQSLTVRTISQHVAIGSIALDPSYLSANAKIRVSGIVLRYRHGRRASHPLHISEAAALELRRAGSSPRFIVWKVRGR